MSIQPIWFLAELDHPPLPTPCPETHHGFLWRTAGHPWVCWGCQPPPAGAHVAVTLPDQQETQAQARKARRLQGQAALRREAKAHEERLYGSDEDEE